MQDEVHGHWERFRQPLSCGWNLKHSEFNRAEIQRGMGAHLTTPRVKVHSCTWSLLWNVIDCRGSMKQWLVMISGFSVQPAEFSFSRLLRAQFFPGGKWTWSAKCSRCRCAAKVGKAGRNSGMKLSSSFRPTTSLPLVGLNEACCVRFFPGLGAKWANDNVTTLSRWKQWIHQSRLIHQSRRSWMVVLQRGTSMGWGMALHRWTRRQTKSRDWWK